MNVSVSFTSSPNDIQAETDNNGDFIISNFCLGDTLLFKQTDYVDLIQNISLLSATIQMAGKGK